MQVTLNLRKMVKRKKSMKRMKMKMMTGVLGRLRHRQKGRDQIGTMIQMMMTMMVEKMMRDHPSDRGRPHLGLRTDH